MSVGHSTVYRKSGPPAKAHRRATMEAWTEDIKAADSPDLGRRMLAEKQAALQLLPPPRPRQVPKPKQAEPKQAEAKQAEAVKQAPRTGAYAHGMSMAATLEKVCMRPDITWRGKSVALALAAHWPHVRPSNPRLRLLTGHGKKTVERGLAELKAKGLLTWKRGKPRIANEYTCKWLSHRASQTLP